MPGKVMVSGRILSFPSKNISKTMGKMKANSQSKKRVQGSKKKKAKIVIKVMVSSMNQ
jgi:hypothetical protein